MKYTKRKITKIINEMLTYFYSVGSTKIDISLEDDENAHYITFKCDFDIAYSEEVHKLKTLLNAGRNPEFEEMYWNLTGLSDLEDETELQLISSLIDSASIYIEENQCTLYLIRKRTISH